MLIKVKLPTVAMLTSYLHPPDVIVVVTFIIDNISISIMQSGKFSGPVKYFIGG